MNSLAHSLARHSRAVPAWQAGSTYIASSLLDRPVRTRSDEVSGKRNAFSPRSQFRCNKETVLRQKFHFLARGKYSPARIPLPYFFSDHPRIRYHGTVYVGVAECINQVRNYIFPGAEIPKSVSVCFIVSPQPRQAEVRRCGICLLLKYEHPDKKRKMQSRAGMRTT